MKHQEYYRKYKANYPPTLDVASVIWAIVVAALVEPFLVLSKIRRIDFSMYEYLEQLEYFLLFAFPVVLFLVYAYRKESIKRHRGYCLVGKFQILEKKTALLNRYLILTPDKEHKLKVDRSLFNKTRIGDYIVIRRDALGAIEEIKHINNLLGRVVKAK